VKQVWHIVAKDLRRMAMPAAVWLLFLVGPAVWFLLGASSGLVLVSESVRAWQDLVEWSSRLPLGLSFALEYILVGAAIVEDPLVGTTAFWQTRPLSPWRWLAAKSTLVVLLFVGVPAVSLIPLRWATGFSVVGAMTAAWPGCLPRLGVAVLAFAVAAATRNLKQFMLATVGTFGGFAGCWLAVVTLRADSSALWNSRHIVFDFGGFFVAMVLLLHQVATRQTARTWTFAVGMVVALTLTSVAWPWDFWTPINRHFSSVHSAAPSRDAALMISIRRAKVDRSFHTLPIETELTTEPASNDVVYFPFQISGEIVEPNGATSNVLSVAQRGPAHDTAEDLSLRRPIHSAVWQFAGQLEDWRSHPLTPPFRLRLSIDLRRSSVRILGELPLVAGAEIGSGYNRSRVVAIEPQADRSTVVLIRELETVAEPNLFGPSLGHAEGRHDTFVLANRAANRAQELSCEELGSSHYNSWLVGFRKLRIPPARVENQWQRDAVIIKVRFEGERTIQRTVETEVTP
jgi:hypothetical protein